MAPAPDTSISDVYLEMKRRSFTIAKGVLGNAARTTEYVCVCVLRGAVCVLTLCVRLVLVSYTARDELGYHRIESKPRNKVCDVVKDGSLLFLVDGGPLQPFQYKLHATSTAGALPSPSPDKPPAMPAAAASSSTARGRTRGSGTSGTASGLRRPGAKGVRSSGVTRGGAGRSAGGALDVGGGGGRMHDEYHDEAGGGDDYDDDDDDDDGSVGPYAGMDPLQRAKAEAFQQVEDVREAYAKNLETKMRAYRNLRSRLMQEKQLRWMQNMRNDDAQKRGRNVNHWSVPQVAEWVESDMELPQCVGAGSPR